MTRKELGDRIADARKQAKMSPELLAGTIGVSLDTLRRYETGESEPGAVVVWKIAVATGKGFGWFAGERRRVRDEAQLDEALRAALRARLDQLEAGLRDVQRLLQSA